MRQGTSWLLPGRNGYGRDKTVGGELAIHRRPEHSRDFQSHDKYPKVALPLPSFSFSNLHCANLFLSTPSVKVLIVRISV